MRRLIVLLFAVIVMAGGLFAGCSSRETEETQSHASQASFERQEEEVVENVKKSPDERISTVKNETKDITEIPNELIEEMGVFFNSFLKAYIEGDEETFKTYMSEEFYNEYLDFEVGSENYYYHSIYYLNMIVDDELIGWSIFNPDPNMPGIHYPGISFFTRLLRQSDIDNGNELGMKCIVNISHNENREYLINWFTFEH